MAATPPLPPIEPSTVSRRLSARASSDKRRSVDRFADNPVEVCYTRNPRGCWVDVAAAQIRAQAADMMSLTTREACGHRARSTEPSLGLRVERSTSASQRGPAPKLRICDAATSTQQPSWIGAFSDCAYCPPSGGPLEVRLKPDTTYYTGIETAPGEKMRTVIMAPARTGNAEPGTRNLLAAGLGFKHAHQLLAR